MDRGPSILKYDYLKELNDHNYRMVMYMFTALEVVWGVPYEMMAIDRKMNELAFPRQVGMWYMNRKLGLAHRLCAKVMNRKGHNASLHAGKVIDEVLAKRQQPWYTKVERFMYMMREFEDVHVGARIYVNDDRDDTFSASIHLRDVVATLRGGAMIVVKGTEIISVSKVDRMTIRDMMLYLKDIAI